MEITAGQIIVSLAITITGGLVIVMMGSMIKRVKAFGQDVTNLRKDVITLRQVVNQIPEDILTQNKHTDLCEIQRLRNERDLRDYIDELMAGWGAELKNHITETFG